VKLKISGGLFRCGRCRKSYSNPLGHVCAVRMDRRTPVGTTRLAPKVSVAGRCGSCGQPRNNPLTHVCPPRSDFRKRKAAAKRKAKSPPHLYESCRDEDCRRIPCAAYRAGKAEGIEEGTAASYEAGFAAGAASVSCGCGG